LKILTSIQSWIEERLDLGGIRDFMDEKVVPEHKYHFWYGIGGITLFLYVIQVITGILLLLYYRPSAESAYESVEFIMTSVRYGWLIRSIHSWGANLMIFFLFVHMFSTFFMKAYRKPREMTWMSGAALLVLALAFGFSGYLLPWNKLSFFATKVGTEIAAVIPFVGKQVLIYLRGGEEVTGATLTRFFGFHVALLPMITIVFLIIHLLFVQAQGMSVPPSLQQDYERSPRSMKFFPDFLLRDAVGWLAVLGLLGILAAIFPWELGEKADPFAPAPPGIRPEWFFVFMFQTLKYIPGRILSLNGEALAILGFGLGFFFWFLVPFFDRRSQHNLSSRTFTIIGIVLVIYIIGMTAVSYLLD
jgi:cytochrome b6